MAKKNLVQCNHRIYRNKLWNYNSPDKIQILLIQLYRYVFVFCHTVTKDTAIDDTNLSWLWSVISRVKSLCCDLVMGGWLGSRSQRSFVSLCSDFKCSYTKSQIIAAKKELLRNVEKYISGVDNRLHGRMHFTLGTVYKYKSSFRTL